MSLACAGTSISVYGAPCKINECLATGLSVIVTNVPEVAQEVSAMSAGIVIDYKVEALANAVITLLSDQALLQTYKKNALRLGQEYLWDTVFDAQLPKPSEYCANKNPIGMRTR